MAYGPQAKYFQDEIRQNLRHNKVGIVGMSNNRVNENGSAFYITLNPDLSYLDDKHTIFGEVVEGLDVLARLNETFCDKDYRPYQNLRIKHTSILDDPFEDDLPGLEYPDESPVAHTDDFDKGRLRDDEHWLEDYEGMAAEDIQKVGRRESCICACIVAATVVSAVF